MAILFHIVWALLWMAFITAEPPPSYGMMRDKRFMTKLKRKNNWADVLLNPLSGPELPYFDNIAFTAPCIPEQVRVFVDTGSSDFWLDSRMWCDCPNADRNVEFCAAVANMKKRNLGQWLKYDDTFAVYGDLLNGNVIFGKGETLRILENTDFVAAWDFENELQTNRPSGMVGLGYRINQQVTSKGYYSTLPYALKERNFTASNVFSMWFEDTEAGQDFTAHALFGGYVSNLFIGDFTTFPIRIEREQPTSAPREISINLDAIRFRGADVFSRCENYLPVLLDTGSYSSWLPLDTFKALADKLGRNEIVPNGKRLTAIFNDCSKWTFEGNVYFQFGNVQIPVPLTDIVRWPTQKEIDSKRFPTITSSKQCITHGITTWPRPISNEVRNALKGPGAPSELSDLPILGVTFLRHAFILYDLYERQVGLAPIDQYSIKNVKPDLFSFIDGFPHQGQPGYNPVLGTPEICYS